MKDIIFFNLSFEHCLRGEKMQNKRFTGVRLNSKDREMLENIAKKYDIAISDVIRMAIKEFLKNNEIKLKEGTT